MELLFIPAILEHDWDTLRTKLLIVFIFWAMMVFAVLIDLWSGTERARALGQRIKSGRLRDTVTKVGEYWRVLAFGLMVDIIASPLPFYAAPYGSMLASVAIVLIEVKSVLENLRQKKSAAAKIPEVIEQILSCRDVEKLADLVENLRRLSDKKTPDKHDDTNEG